MTDMDLDDELSQYTPKEVARLFRVDPKTVARWAEQGDFPENTVSRTPGGHRRFKKANIKRMLMESAE